MIQMFKLDVPDGPGTPVLNIWITKVEHLDHQG
jgi:hypothetical protein